MFDNIKEKVYEANIQLYKQGLVPLTWGNVSARVEDYIIINHLVLNMKKCRHRIWLFWI